LIAARFDVDLASVGLLTSAVFLAQVVTQVPGGRLIDRHGPRRVGLVCLLFCGIGNGAVLVAPDLAWAVALRFLVGIGSGVGFVAGASYIRLLGGTGQAQGVYGGFSIGGGGLAIATVAWTSQYLGWRAVFASSLVIALAAMAALAWSAPTERPDTRNGALRFRPLLSSPVIWRLAVCQAATFGFSILVSSWLVVFLVDRDEMSPGEAGLVTGLVLVGGILGRPWGGWVTQRHPERRRIAVVLSLIGAGVSMIVLVLVPGLPTAVVCTALFGFAVGVPFGPIFDTVTRAHSAGPGLAIAVMNAPAMVLIAAGSPLLGVALSQWSRPGLAFLVLGVPLLALATLAQLGRGGAEAERTGDSSAGAAGTDAGMSAAGGRSGLTSGPEADDRQL
jgi:predicted MFS family arabinose efflux permease